MLIFGLAEIAPALAQSVPPPDRARRMVAPDEVLTMLRSTELTPLERPTRRGVTYALRAVDADGDQVRVIVDARTGAILTVTPIERSDLAGPGLRRPQEPDGYVGPGPAPRSAPSVFYEPNAPTYRPRPPGAVPGAPVAGVPRDDDAAPPQIMTPEPGSGVLPPPPERFPQRVAPGPEPKAKPAPPRRTVSAAPPKSPPLPKPRPEARLPQPPAAPAQPAIGPPPAPEPAPDDVPH